MAIMVAISLAACSAKTPNCSDDRTLHLVKKILLDMGGVIVNEEIVKEVFENIKIDLSRADAFDEKINKYSCAANLTIDLNPYKPIKFEMSRPSSAFVLMTGYVDHTTVTYYSQIGDKGEHLVNVVFSNNVEFESLKYYLAELVHNVQIKKNNTTKPADTAVPVPAAPVPVPVPAAAVPVPAAAAKVSPSFDCTKASNNAEKLVCSDNQLAQLDLELTAAYTKARDRSADPSKLKADQIAWIKMSRQCGDKQCLEQAYKMRISQFLK